jgi:hypothetical protein
MNVVLIRRGPGSAGACDERRRSREGAYMRVAVTSHVRGFGGLSHVSQSPE